MFSDISNVVVGQFITFLYMGGSHPNTIRRVYVQKVNWAKKYITGFDVDPHDIDDMPIKGCHDFCKYPAGIRNFKFDKMANILCTNMNEETKKEFTNYIAANFIYSKVKSENISIDTINTILNIYNNSILKADE